MSAIMPPEPLPDISTLMAPGADPKGALPEAFQHFIRSAEKAQNAFVALSSKVEELKAELDDTNQKLRNKVDELDRLSGHLTCLLNSLSDGVVVVDKSGSIRLFNPAAEIISGRNADVMVGTPLNQWLRHDSPVFERIQDVLSNGHQKNFTNNRCQIQVTRVDGTMVPVAAGAAPVKDKQGDVLGVVLVLADLTDWDALQKKVQHAEALAEMGRLSAVLAHEVRNPLSGIEGFAGLLQRDLKTLPEKKRYADMIVEGVRDLNRLVESLLSFARIPDLRLAELNVHHMLEELGQLSLAGLKDNSGLKVVVKCLTNKPVMLADRGALRQAFLNLIRNSLEAMQSRGTGTVTMTIAADCHDSYDALKITVADNGPGIPAKVKESLFRPFVTTKSQGTGLGLPMVAKMITAHGGVVKYEDAPGGGACFQVYLPKKAMS